MGLRLGFLAVDRPWPNTKTLLEQYFGPMGQEQRADGSWEAVAGGEDLLYIAAVNGQTHILDTSMVLSSCADFVLQLSRELRCVAVAGLGESISGTYALLVADEGQLLRDYYTISSICPRPYTRGTPLPFESAVGIEDRDGEGLFACLEAFGFDRSSLLGTQGGIRASWFNGTLPPRGPLDMAHSAHVEQFPRDDEAWLRSLTAQERPAVQARRAAAETRTRSGWPWRRGSSGHGKAT